MTRMGLYLGLAFLLLASSMQNASADLPWDWSFDSNAGMLTTDGTLSDAGGPFDFTIESFSDGFNPTSSPVGFSWDGSMVTAFNPPFTIQNNNPLQQIQFSIADLGGGDQSVARGRIQEAPGSWSSWSAFAPLTLAAVIPEPSTLALAMIAFGGLAHYGWARSAGGQGRRGGDSIVP